MGLSSSKLCRSDSTESKNEPPKDAVKINDPRSPTGEISRTPIVFEKVKPYLETDIDDIPSKEEDYIKVLPLRNKLLKNLSIDPRSPTAGINRTPILVEETPNCLKSCKGNEFCDSPISIYSSNYSESDSLIDITAPPDPSYVVSDYNKSIDGNETFGSLINQFSISDLLSEDENKSEESNESVIETPLKVSVKPTTQEAEKLMTEILSSTEIDDGDFIQKVKKPGKTLKSQKKLSIHVDDDDKAFVKPEIVKPRTPLSNITSAANSPKLKQGLRKSLNKNKIVVDSGLENTKSPRIAQWDHDNTVII